jgi:hypothetical protein
MKTVQEDRTDWAWKWGTIILRGVVKYSIFLIDGLTPERAASSVAMQHRRYALYSEQPGDKKDSLYLPIDTA